MSEGTGKSQAGLRAAKNYAPPGFNNIAPYSLVKGAAEFIGIPEGGFRGNGAGSSAAAGRVFTG